MELWNGMNVLTEMMPPSSHRAALSPNSETAPFRPYWQQGLAACLVLVMMFGLHMGLQSPEVFVTKIGEQRQVQLSDGTTVLLDTGTRIEVSYSDSSRSVVLSYGQAHFEVAHNPALPFEVFAGQGKVRAVGTAFTVYLKSDDVEVVVTEGVVEILPKAALSKEEARPPANTKQNPPLLLANNSDKRVKAGNVATYDRHTAEHVMQAALDKSGDKISWHKGLLVFRNEPLENVIEELNRYTDIKIIIPDKTVRAMKVGGFFKASDINSVFDALEQGFNIQAQVVSKHVVYLVYVGE